MSDSESQDNSRFRQFVDQVHTDDALDAIPYVVHRLASKEETDHPQIAWIWPGGQIDSNTESSASIVTGECSVKVPYVDNVAVQIHVWGEDFEQAEAMRNCMIGALDRNLGAGQLTFGTYTWWNEQEETAEHDISGVKCIMNVSFPLLIATEFAPTKQLVGAQIDATFQDNPAGSTIENVHTSTVP